jgi:uncharacterized membrane protein YfcA
MNSRRIAIDWRKLTVWLLFYLVAGFVLGVAVMLYVIPALLSSDPFLIAGASLIVIGVIMAFSGLWDGARKIATNQRLWSKTQKNPHDAG